jgi:hypothetical protein
MPSPLALGLIELHTSAVVFGLSVRLSDRATLVFGLSDRAIFVFV